MRFNAGVLLVVVMATIPGVCQAQTGTLADASIVAWGLNSYGQCDVPSGYTFIGMGGGGVHVPALRSDGSLIAWGNNDYGQCNVPVGYSFTDVAAGGFHSVALRSNGTLAAWGRNTSGQVNVPAGNNYVQVDAGSYNSYALRADGSLVAWGSNATGECNVPAGTDFVMVDGGGQTGFAIRSDGSLAAWGQNGDGQANVPAGNGFVQVRGGGNHGVAVKTDGSLAAWGQNDYGQANAPSGNDFSSVGASGHTSYAIRSNGSIVAWGADNYGQVSDTPASGFFFSVTGGANHATALRARDVYDADLQVTGTGRSATLNRSVSVAGNVLVQSSMTVANNPTMTVSGTINLTGGNSINGSGTLTLQSPTGVPTLNVTLGGSFVISSIGGTQGLAYTGSGPLSLYGVNTYTGPTLIYGPDLKIISDAGLGAVPSTPTPGSIVLDGGTLEFVGSYALSSKRGMYIRPAGGTLNVPGGQTIAYGGVIDGPGPFAVVAPGTFIMSGSNTYTGLTAIANATLRLAAGDNRIRTTNDLKILSGKFDLAGFSQTLDELFGAGTAAASPAGVARQIKPWPGFPLYFHRSGHPDH